MQIFQLQSAVIILESVDMMVRNGGGEAANNCIVKKSAFSGSVCLGCDLCS